jgi:hypothetical protein
MIANTLLTLLCAGVFLTCFCRMVQMDRSTRLSVRAAVYCLSMAALCAAVSPWWWGIQAQWTCVAMSGAILAVQGASSQLWAHGVPHQYQKSEGVGFVFPAGYQTGVGQK